jgi:hypothetical protein
LEENLDEVNDKTVPRWRGEAASPMAMVRRLARSDAIFAGTRPGPA